MKRLHTLLLTLLAGALFVVGPGLVSCLAMAELFTGPDGQRLTARGWGAYANTGSGSIVVSTNMAHLNAANAEAVARDLGGYSPDRAVDRYLYYKVKVSVTALPTSGQSGQYFAALRSSADGSTRAHLWIKYNTSTSAKVGISYNATDTPQYPIGTLALNTSTELLIKLDRGDGTTKPSAKITNLSGNYSATSTSTVDETWLPDSVALRQSNTTGGMGDLLIDEVLTGTAQNDVVGPIYDIAAYGATTTSTGAVNDDEPAIQAAITACTATRTHGIVVFPPGRYDVTGSTFSSATGGETAFYIHNATDLTIQGNGALIRMRSGSDDSVAAYLPLRAQAFYIANSTNTVVKALSIDWMRPPFTAVTVESVTTDIAGTQWTVVGSVDTAVFPMPTSNIADHDPIWNVESVIDWEPTLGAPLSNISFYDQTDANIVSSYNASTGKWTLVLHYGGTNTEVKTHVTNAMAALTGRKLILRHKTGGTSSPDIYGNNCIQIGASTNTQLQDVIILASNGMGLQAVQSTDITLSRCKLQPSSAARLLSTLVDGTFFTFCKGTITIDSCYYKNTGDDSANVNAKFMKVVTISGKLVTVVPGVGSVGPQGVVNEVYEFQRGDDRSQINPGTVHQLTLNAVANATAGGADVPGWDLTFNDVTGLSVGDLVVTTAWSPVWKVLDTTFDGSHARGLIVSTRQVLIDGCTFRNQSFNGIMVMADPDKSGAQGPGAQNVTISNNVFEACGAAPIALISHSGGGAPARPSAAGMFRNFTIANNTFRRNRTGITPKINDLRLARSTTGAAGSDIKMAYYQSAIVLNALDVVASTDLNSVVDNTFAGTGAADGFEPVIYLNHVANQYSTDQAYQIAIETNTCSGMFWQKSSVTPAPNVIGGAGFLMQANQLSDLLDNAIAGYDRQLGDIR